MKYKDGVLCKQKSNLKVVLVSQTPHCTHSVQPNLAKMSLSDASVHLYSVYSVLPNLAETHVQHVCTAAIPGRSVCERPD